MAPVAIGTDHHFRHHLLHLQAVSIQAIPAEEEQCLLVQDNSLNMSYNRESRDDLERRDCHVTSLLFPPVVLLRVVDNSIPSSRIAPLRALSSQRARLQNSKEKVKRRTSLIGSRISCTLRRYDERNITSRSQKVPRPFRPLREILVIWEHHLFPWTLALVNASPQYQISSGATGVVLVVLQR